MRISSPTQISGFGPKRSASTPVSELVPCCMNWRTARINPTDAAVHPNPSTKCTEISGTTIKNPPQERKVAARITAKPRFRTCSGKVWVDCTRSRSLRDQLTLRSSREIIRSLMHSLPPGAEHRHRAEQRNSRQDPENRTVTTPVAVGDAGSDRGKRPRACQEESHGAADRSEKGAPKEICNQSGPHQRHHPTPRTEEQNGYD